MNTALKIIIISVISILAYSTDDNNLRLEYIKIISGLAVTLFLPGKKKRESQEQQNVNSSSDNNVNE